MMKIYIFTITYNFDSDTIVRKCNTHKEAIKMLNNFLEEEIQVVKVENEYIPSILKWGEDDITLVYAEGYSKDDKNSNYRIEDCAYYRIFEVEI